MTSDDIRRRNVELCAAYQNGETIPSISSRTGLSCTQLSRIFRSAKVYRPKFELDIAFFEENVGKSIKQISIETGLSTRRIRHLKWLASNGRLGLNNITKDQWGKAACCLLGDGQPAVSWQYKPLSVPYSDNGTLKNAEIDVGITWNDGLTTYISQRKLDLPEAAYAEIIEFLRSKRSNLILIDSLSGFMANAKFTMPSEFRWIIGNRYECRKSYLRYHPLYLEAFRHQLTAALIQWQPFQYTEHELANDIELMKSENISLYSTPAWRTTIPSGRGMPGRKSILQFQPHFHDLQISDRLPLSHAFSNNWIIYRSLLQSMEEEEGLSLERLIREINFHFTRYGRVSHFAPGFARAIIRAFGSGKRIYDPCCGWGGRMLGAWLEGCSYSGCELSTQTYVGLRQLMKHIGYNANILNKSCLDITWPQNDLIFTSPPFYNIEKYSGSNQPWQMFKTRQEWRNRFVLPFIQKINAKTVLYLDAETRDDFAMFKPFSSVIEISNKRHARMASGCEFLCIYDVCQSASILDEYYYARRERDAGLADVEFKVIRR